MTYLQKRNKDYLHESIDKKVFDSREKNMTVSRGFIGLLDSIIPKEKGLICSCVIRLSIVRSVKVSSGISWSFGSNWFAWMEFSSIACKIFWHDRLEMVTLTLNRRMIILIGVNWDNPLLRSLFSFGLIIPRAIIFHQCFP